MEKRKPRAAIRKELRVNKIHIIQGGIENGDKDLLIRRGRDHKPISSWVAPKFVQVGDDVVIYVLGLGFFATARVNSVARPRKD